MKSLLTTLVVLTLPALAHAHGGHPAADDPATHSLLHLIPAAALIALTFGALAINRLGRKPAPVTND